jgi:hypothetical protein
MPGKDVGSTWRMCRVVAALSRVEGNMNGGLLL